MSWNGGTYEQSREDIIACEVAVIVIDWCAVIDGFGGALRSVG